jgi:NADPH:quinone reductase-like Zn-dependent oxidoreductase
MFDAGMYDPTIEAVAGHEAAGEVLAVGDGVTHVKVGDSVIAGSNGMNILHPERGAYADYYVAPAKTVWKTASQPLKDVDSSAQSLDSGEITTYAGASSVGVGVYTMAVYFEWLNKTPIKKNIVTPDNHYLVWGASSSLGAIALQMAKYMGYTVVATASSKNHDLIRSFGADAVFDYHDADVIDKIRTFSGDKLTTALDAIGGSDDIVRAIFECMAKTRLAKVSSSHSSPHYQEIAKSYPNVNADFCPTYIAIEDRRLFSPNGPELVAPPGAHEACARAFANASVLLREPGVIRHLPIRIVPGGLSGVVSGFDIFRQRPNSAEKLVIVL